jgi:hypothetical protein
VKRGGYIDRRLEKWGAWRVGARGVAVATWSRLRHGPVARATDDDDRVPELHLEERETHELLGCMARTRETRHLAEFALLAYPRQSRLAQRLGMDKQALLERYRQLWRAVGRLLDQRRRGEPLDPSRKRAPAKARTIRAQVPQSRRPRSIASVAVD